MTFYTLRGIKTARNMADDVVAVTATTVTLELAAGTPANFSYVFDDPSDPAPDPDDLALAEATGPSYLSIDLEGGDIDDGTDFYVGQVTHAGGTSYVMSFTIAPVGQPATDWYFVIGGADLPAMDESADPVAAWAAFEATVRDVGAILTGPYAPGREIPLADMPGGIVSTGGSVLRDSPADDTIRTGGGNHFLVNEGGGIDVTEAGGGDDVILLGSGPGGGEHTVRPGPGNDILDLSDIGPDPDDPGGPALVPSYVTLDHGDLDAGIDVTLHVPHNTGFVDKGVNGRTTMINPQVPVLAEGMGIFGTAHADSFDLTPGGGGFLQVRGQGGNDTIRIGDGDGTIRLDYRGAASGIVADLSTGIVSQDGHGGRDSITGPGQASELRGTMNDDRITGSDAGERFILMAGDDTLDAGGGDDMLRYDRTGVGAVDANLETGTATGTWRGSAFTHTVSGVEMLRGSNTGDDTLTGADGQGNALDGRGGNDLLTGGDTSDTLIGGAGDDTLDGGGGGRDRALFAVTQAEASISFGSGDTVLVSHFDAASGMTYEDTLTSIELLEFTDGTVTVSSLRPAVDTTGTETGDTLPGGAGDDRVDGAGGDDTLDGGAGDDTLLGGTGDDTLDGGDGADRLNGGDGADTVTGGTSPDDLADVIYGGDGDDLLTGGYGNDQIFGMGGNDTIAGGFGADNLQGQDGNDVITGSAFADQVFGGIGDDFVNGGFGHDLINGGAGADKFYHLGIFDHGSDWVQDYSAAEGDVLLFGNAAASRDQFQVNFTHTATAAGERSGDDDVEEAFVIYRPTGQIIWALVDGGGEASINLTIGADTFDLLA